MKEFVARNKLYVFMIVLFAVFGFLSIIPLNKYKSTKEYVVNYYNDLSLKCNNDEYENLTERGLYPVVSPVMTIEESVKT